MMHASHDEPAHRLAAEAFKLAQRRERRDLADEIHQLLEAYPAPLAGGR